MCSSVMIRFAKRVFTLYRARTQQKACNQQDKYVKRLLIQDNKDMQKVRALRTI